MNSKSAAPSTGAVASGQAQASGEGGDRSFGEESEPPLGLLVSMAMRCDHGFAMNSHRAQQVALSDMRRCWEEMTGRGFYAPEREEYYRKALRPEGDPGFDAYGLFATPVEGARTDPTRSPAGDAAGQEVAGHPTQGHAETKDRQRG